jgi:SAM-dependent methyltransferase
MVLPDTTHRHPEPELMDGPDLEPARHASALKALARVNALSLTASAVWAEIRRMRPNGTRPLRILDVACGGGDVVVALARKAARSGVRLEVHGCDVSPFAVAYAREAARRKAVEAHFFQQDALASPIPDGYDLVCSSLFLHHLSEREAVRFLRSMAAAGRSLLVQDLVRGRVGYVMALLTLHVVSRSDVARVDGPRSVRSAFTLPEAEELVRRAGLEGAAVRRCWPQRWQILWSAT